MHAYYAAPDADPTVRVKSVILTNPAASANCAPGTSIHPNRPGKCSGSLESYSPDCRRTAVCRRGEIWKGSDRSASNFGRTAGISPRVFANTSRPNVPITGSCRSEAIRRAALSSSRIRSARTSRASAKASLSPAPSEPRNSMTATGWESERVWIHGGDCHAPSTCSTAGGIQTVGARIFGIRARSARYSSAISGLVLETTRN